MTKEQRTNLKFSDFSREQEQRTCKNQGKSEEKSTFNQEQRTSLILNPYEEKRTFSFCSENDYHISEFSEQFFVSLRSNDRSQYTINFYKEKLSKFFDWLKEQQIYLLPELKPNVIRSFLSQYKENHTIGGTHAYYRAIKSYLNWVWYEYDIESLNPINKVKCPNRQVEPIQGVSTDDVDKLFQSAKAGMLPIRDCAILAILLDTGIRRSSLYELQKQDVDPITGCLYIRHMKNKKPMTVYLGNKARKYVRKLIRSLPPELPDDSTIWFNQDGSPMELDNLERIINRITKRAGLESYSLHDFRRYFALEAYRNGADIFEVSAMLNHSNIEVTKRYIAIDENDKKTMHNKISPLDKNK